MTSINVVAWRNRPPTIRVLETAEENEADLFAQAKLFETDALPILTAVGIA